MAELLQIDAGKAGRRDEHVRSEDNGNKRKQHVCNPFKPRFPADLSNRQKLVASMPNTPLPAKYARRTLEKPGPWLHDTRALALSKAGGEKRAAFVSLRRRPSPSL